MNLNPWFDNSERMDIKYIYEGILSVADRHMPLTSNSKRSIQVQLKVCNSWENAHLNFEWLSYPFIFIWLTEIYA